MNIVFYLKHIFEKYLLRFFLEFLFLLDLSWIPSQGSQWSPRSPVFRTLRKNAWTIHIQRPSWKLLEHFLFSYLLVVANIKSVLNMGRLRRKRMHKNDKHLKKKYRTKRRTKDLDQIHVDMQPQNAAKLKSQEVDMDLPGAGQYYCIQCA